eukprot:TRINITY_DN8964_c0_g1_i1.p1 TRINITY_DN8964_c0_g1~~TRINITY_DN8964_c0_g1_i1.p1  ORF type:complete len:292 (+),score=41.14 TRINITY_DN8964_c0_g1_i1:17-892(+)
MGAEVSPFHLTVASAVAGLVSRICTHPLDTVRAREMHGSFSDVRGLLPTLRAIVAREGFAALYRGLGIALIVQGPAQATYLSTYEVAKQRASKFGEESGIGAESPVVHLACGLAAEAVSGLFWVPMEVIKQRMQVNLPNYQKSTFAALNEMASAARRNGIASLFRGYWMTLAVFGPYSMVYFSVYEQFRKVGARLIETDITGAPSTSVIFTSAALASGVSAAVTTPLDVVKTRLQTHPEYNSGLVALREIIRTDGASALLRGLTARVGWMMPGTAITMSAFELLKQGLRDV